MNLYRYRVVERTTTTIIAGKSTERITYCLQESFLGIMWADMFNSHGNLYSYRTHQDAIIAYDSFSKKEVIKDKVVHPVKETP